ncbi:MAG: SAM-dependent methyltransferase, partial [Alphaproteobacteria bacterium]
AWLATLAAPVLARLPEEERPGLAADCAALLAPVLRDADGQWWADYVRIRFAAHRPGGS